MVFSAARSAPCLSQQRALHRVLLSNTLSAAAGSGSHSSLQQALARALRRSRLWLVLSGAAGSGSYSPVQQALARSLRCSRLWLALFVAAGSGSRALRRSRLWLSCSSLQQALALVLFAAAGSGSRTLRCTVLSPTTRSATCLRRACLNNTPVCSLAESGPAGQVAASSSVRGSCYREATRFRRATAWALAI